MSDRGRTFVAVGCLVVPVAVVLIGRTLVGDRMPPRLASHWSGVDVDPDGFMAPSTLTNGALVTTVAMLALGVVIAVLPIDRRHLPMSFALLGVCGAAGCLVWLSSVSATMTAESPEQARLRVWLPIILVGMIGGLALGLVVPGAKPDEDGESVPALVGVEGSTAAPWRGRARSPVLLVLCLLALVAAGVGAAFWLAGAGWWATTSAMTGAVVFVVVLPLISVVVIIDGEGLVVPSALLGLRLRRIPLADIRKARASDILPAEWGGWGWRWMPGRSAVVLRTGPGIVIGTKHGEFAVTVEDAGKGAAVLNVLLRPVS